MAIVTLLEIFAAAISFVVVRFLLNKNSQPINWPVFGMLPDTLFHFHRAHDRFTEVIERSGHTFFYQGPWFSNVKLLATVEPANVHHIMSSNFSNFPKGSEFSKIFDILGRGIFNSDSEWWKNQRKLAQALINHRRFHQFLVKSCRDMVEKGLVPVLEHAAEQGLVMDMQDLFQRFTFDITCILATGYNPRCLSIDFPDVEFSKAMDDTEETLFFRHLTPEWFWKLQRSLRIGQEWKMQRAWKTLDRLSAEYISRKRKQLSNQSPLPENGSDGVDLLTSYMSDAEIMGSKPDDKFLRDTIINLLLAGRDTTSSALTWFLWLVSKNPQVESKIREELKEIIPKDDAENWRIFNPQELNRLVYLHGALCESLRLYPPVPFQHKAPLQEDVLPSGHRVNPEMKIVVCLYSMGRMSSIWGEDCLEFKPERWITEGGKIRHEPSYKFFAFNAGPRTCLGKEVAFIQMKTVAAAIIHNYHVQVVEGHPVSPNVSIILQMKHGLKVRISRRWV
ncbi:hypothetical protein P3X46_012885 [Hevea brasiliensis]|uniref:Cytochrome P450 n=1 Tax=Hevea brasiliensis TaxID=3981 RepID=A0ABQ9MEB6_HEVBR|nr:alkane hydroxylase MAH1 [Hevea brasiliensis]KAJ9177695.1 hypothetical protein P3X46_012885 [Hevea brasiliensis]